MGRQSKDLGRLSGGAVVLASLVLGLGAGIGAAGCGEDRDGSVDVEGGTTGGTVGTGTTGATTPDTTGTTGY